MFDNNGRYPMYTDIIQYASRLSNIQRTMDINISQQKTPRFWKTPTEKVKSIKDLVENFDGNSDAVIGYDDLDLDETNIVLSPAPYVADKLSEEKQRLWNEFLRLIGVANASFQKKERNIRDEVISSQGGTIASRFTRFTPRERAIKEINQKFGTNIEVGFYDGLPTTLTEMEELLEQYKVDDEGDEDDDLQ